MRTILSLALGLPVDINKTQYVQETEIVHSTPSEVNDTLANLGIKQDVINALASVSKETNIKEEYFGIIGLSENIILPDDIGDGGCSIGIYQFNMCAGRKNPETGKYIREEQFWFGKFFPECARDYRCSTLVTAEKIKTVYGCNILEDGTITNWEDCLSKHQGTNPAEWYKAKIKRYGDILLQ